MEQTEHQENKIGTRLKAVRLSKKMTIEEFYSPITEHTSNCAAVENGRRKIGKRLSRDIIRFYHLNEHWLHTGEGEMFMSQATETDEVRDPGVPYFNVNLTEISYKEENIFNDPPEYYVNFRPFNNCDAYLPIYGDSMFPKYASGEVIVIQEILNFDVIQWGEAYLVVADSRANSLTTVKLLFEHPDPSKIILRASNPNFKGDTVLPKDYIKKMFIVKGKITRHQL